jgi:retron-type reverse transcriptase
LLLEKIRGGRYADKLLTNYINEIRLKEKEKDIYCLSVDISKYFYNINHNILFNKLKKDIDDLDILNLLKIIIDETNKEYVNKTIYKLNEINDTNVPFYDYDIGLSIGAMTSQFLAIYYLNDLDHYIKEKLRCKYYVRYMDDFIILDTNKEKLKEIFKILEIEINKLDLKVNPKSNIKNLKNGINFLGYKYILLEINLILNIKVRLYIRSDID